MEAADLYVVNKADRPGAEKLAREVEVTLGFRTGHTFRGIRAHHGVPVQGGAKAPPPETDGSPVWEHPVLLTAASRGEGTGALVDALARHHQWMSDTGELAARRARRLAARTREVVDRSVHRWIWRETRADELVRERLDDLAAGRISPYELAGEIVAGIKEGARV
jgi:LAO/AO transport system kinase